MLKQDFGQTLGFSSTYNTIESRPRTDWILHARLEAASSCQTRARNASRILRGKAPSKCHVQCECWVIMLVFLQYRWGVNMTGPCFHSRTPTNAPGRHHRLRQGWARFDEAFGSALGNAILGSRKLSGWSLRWSTTDHLEQKSWKPTVRPPCWRHLPHVCKGFWSCTGPMWVLRTG